ncbi:MAG TPA: OmpW family outer membrane protein [Hyphomicrobium sp.]|jgi:outer membrane protein
MMRKTRLWIGAFALLVCAASVVPAQAGDSNGNFQVKLGVTGVIFDDETTSTTLNGAAAALGQAETNDTVLPTLMLTYFLDKNWALELFCCFAQVNVRGDTGALAGLGKLASTWAFPPILTAQYHFDGMGAFRPYVGAGVEWIHYFDENSNLGGGADFDDSWGFALQVGTDIDLGGGWSLGLDAKKVWEDTKITWTGTGLGTVVAEHDLDPWFLTANLGYRFNLSDLFGRREAVPLK